MAEDGTFPGKTLIYLLSHNGQLNAQAMCLCRRNVKTDTPCPATPLQGHRGPTPAPHPWFYPPFVVQCRGPGTASSLFCLGLVLMSWTKASQALVPGKPVPPSSARPEPWRQEQRALCGGTCQLTGRTKEKTTVCFNPLQKIDCVIQNVTELRKCRGK